MGGAFAVAATRSAPASQGAAVAKAKPVTKVIPAATITGLAGFVPAKLPAKLKLKPIVIHPRQIVVVTHRTIIVKAKPTTSGGGSTKDPWGNGTDWSASGSSGGSGGNDTPPPPPPPPGNAAP
jgi:hypothetical protein